MFLIKTLAAIQLSNNINQYCKAGNNNCSNNQILIILLKINKIHSNKNNKQFRHLEMLVYSHLIL